MTVKGPSPVMAEVQLISGDLLDQQVDVIVNAWNRNFIPWWLLVPQGVAAAIRRRGGARPFREVRRHGMMRSGDAVVTSAGRLPHKAIIHVAALTWYWRSNLDIVRRGTDRALALAAQHGFASIAFPVLGSGTGGLKVETAREVMREVAAQHNSSLLVRIVTYERKKAS